MMRAPLIAVALSIVGGAVCAQTQDGLKGLESCFHAARLADAICSSLPNDPVQRLDCFKKVREAQIECLEHVPSGMSARSAAPKMPRAVSPDVPTVTRLPEVPAGAVSPEMLIGTAPADKSTSIVSPKTTQPLPPTATVPPNKLTGPISPDMSGRAVDIPAKPPDTNWVISETTSPVDNSPLITALIRSTSNVKDAPNSLAIRCRGVRTELLLRTEGTWRVSRASDVQVDYQINDQPSVRLQWTASADGKTASYKDDAVELLRSLTEGAQLKISVFDRPGSSREATFQLAGLDAIRKKIGLACKWPPMADKMSSGKL